MNNTYSYFECNMNILENALHSIDVEEFKRLLAECEKALRRGNKIIASGLGKNVPICEKFEGTMISAGMNAQFLHTNSAVHGDMGMVKPGDLVIILSKSGSTAESVYLVDLLKERKGVILWLLSCNAQSILADKVENKLIIPLEHEGDPWNIMPNNSTTLYLIVLQQIAMLLIERMGITLEDFRRNHPGGAIGEKLRHG